MPTDFKKKALLIVHQRRSNTGDVGLKLRQRGYSLDVRKPALGDEYVSYTHLRAHET